MEDLRQLIIEARQQRSDIASETSQAEAQKSKLETEKARKNFILWRNLFKKRVAQIDEKVGTLREELSALSDATAHSQVSADFEIPEEAARTYGAVCAAFEDLRQCTKAWQIPTERDVDRARTRSAASLSIKRNSVAVGYQPCALLSSDSTPMRFQNNDGEDIFIYPSMAVMPRSDGAFALIDLRELFANLHNQQFIEEEAVPTDAQVIRYAWEKSNRHGSRDKRFANNRQIPVLVWRNKLRQQRRRAGAIFVLQRCGGG